MKSNKKETSCILCALNHRKSSNNEEYRNKVQEQIKGFELEMKDGELSFDVSEVKTFTQLWDDYGLRDYGEGHTDIGTYSIDDKFFVLNCWIKHLYSEQYDITEIYFRVIPDALVLFDEHKKTNNDALPSPIDFVPQAIDNLLSSPGFQIKVTWL